MRGIILIFIVSIVQTGFAQSYFPERCKGEWEGVMHIYQKGVLKDSVRVEFSVTSIDKNSWTWKTKYISDKFPMTKDYVLRLSDSSGNRYMVDEGGGVALYDYLFGNKLYSVFETHNILLTSSYELTTKGELIFEVTSGKKIQGKDTDEVINYTVDSVQRIVLQRRK